MKKSRRMTGGLGQVYVGSPPTRVGGHTRFNHQPRAEIASKQALYTLAKLHAELGGKLRTRALWNTRTSRATIPVATVLLAISKPGHGRNGVSKPARPADRATAD
jgi:hypothetical protein